MKLSRFCIFFCLPLIFVNLYAIFNNIVWLARVSEISIFIPLFIGFFKKLDFRNINVSAFISLTILAILLRYFQNISFIYFLSIFLNMFSYTFLIREALRYTYRETGNKFMLFFFFLLISGNAYFGFLHLQELEVYMNGMIEFTFYLVYYVNLLIFVIVGLIYYLNSYSRKSVYFIAMMMALVVSDILRDMGLFYFPDTSVLLLQHFLSLSAIILTFRFFTTKERKLRLINLI